MNFKTLCEERYSVRNFLSKQVEKEKIDYILRCAQLAPSAANFQPWRFVVVQDEAVLKAVNESYNRDWITSAPMCIVVCKNSEESWKRSATDGKDHADIDAAITAEHICLAAHAIGLGTCWVCNFVPKALSEALSLPASVEPVALFPVGYIDVENSKIPEKKRKPLDETLTWI